VKRSIFALIFSFVSITTFCQRAKDMSDLSFLDTVLKDARIVMLGESSHGTEEYSQVKKQLIQYLHEKLGFNVVLFESPMTNCAYLNIGTDTSGRSLVKNSIQNVWHTETIADLFSYIKRIGIQFNGFDPQFIPSPYRTYVFETAFKNKPELIELERMIASNSHMFDSFSTAYGRLAAEVNKEALSPFQQWVRETMSTNAYYYANINAGKTRDSCMAKNIIWLAENLYKNEKIIIWAHNSHIDRQATASKNYMGAVLSNYFKDQLYGIGLYMLNGTTATNARKIITVKPAPPGSIEEMLAGTGFKTSFIETKYPVFNKAIKTLHWGNKVQKMNLYKSYDAVILVNGVTTPNYLQ
jgi:erythromycin esterase